MKKGKSTKPSKRKYELEGSSQVYARLLRKDINQAEKDLVEAKDRLREDHENAQHLNSFDSLQDKTSQVVDQSAYLDGLNRALELFKQTNPNKGHSWPISKKQD